MNGTEGSALARLAAARRSPAGAPAPLPEEHCDLCGQPIPADHRHLLDLDSGELQCACRPCTILFQREAAGGGHYRLIGDRRVRVADFELDDLLWEELRIPVDMAFFFRSTRAGRVIALYPGPMGTTESLLELDSWRDLEEANPVLASLVPDVEALLVNRARGADSQWIVPIDECYALAGLIRARWRGLTGGREVWEEIGHFFDALGERARTVSQEGGPVSESVPVQAGGEET